MNEHITCLSLATRLYKKQKAISQQINTNIIKTFLCCNNVFVTKVLLNAYGIHFKGLVFERTYNSKANAMFEKSLNNVFMHLTNKTHSLQTSFLKASLH